MQRFDLNQNWEYLESSLQNPLMVGMLQGWKKTSLPHDYAVEKARSPEAATGLDEGFMACAGLYYRKSFTVEPEIIGQRFWLVFEGIAGITEVWLNKKPIAKHNNPYYEDEQAFTEAAAEHSAQMEAFFGTPGKANTAMPGRKRK